MKWIKSALLLVILFGALASESAWADRGHHGGGRGRAHVGVFIGAPLFWPYYPQPYYYPPVVVAPSSPPVYIEQEPLSAQQYWYFCNSPQGYYPYVKQCPSGWQPVTPLPPGN
jgi:hypothetical protein